MIVYIALGSNLSNRDNYLIQAIEMMQQNNITVRNKSSVIETKAYGYTDQPDFLNMVIEAETDYSPQELLEQLNIIEKKLNRTREIHWGPRTIDLDIIFYGDEIIKDTNLCIPHIDMQNRFFVLKPLMELNPNIIHPEYNKTAKELYDDLTIKEALKYASSRDGFGMKLGLENIKELLTRIGNPQDKLNVIHLAGTNGKGSTSNFFNNILLEGGYKVGLFSSPSIINITDMFRINNKDIDTLLFSNYILRIKEIADTMDIEGFYTTIFEQYTAIALLYFYESNVDFAIIEVGLGGRLDSTNVFNKKILSVITSISYDHTDFLGNTISSIAKEKSGIITEDDLVISYDSDDEALNIIKSISSEKNASLHILNFNDINVHTSNENGSYYDFLDYKNIHISLLGEHQIKNSALALLGISLLKEKNLVTISDKNIYDGLQKTIVPGRLEFISSDPRILIDGAHNLSGIVRLVEFIDKLSYNNIYVIVGILKDKEYSHMVQKLADIKNATYIITDVPNQERKLDNKILFEEFAKFIPSPNITISNNNITALETCMKHYKDGDLILITGSLYLISSIRKHIQDIKGDIWRKK